MLKRFAECECACHKVNAVVAHVVPCCDGYSPARSKKKRERLARKTLTAEDAEPAEKTL